MADICLLVSRVVYGIAVTYRIARFCSISHCIDRLPEEPYRANTSLFNWFKIRETRLLLCIVSAHLWQCAADYSLYTVTACASTISVRKCV